MQVTETEILLSLNNSPKLQQFLSRKNLFQTYLAGIISLSLGIFLLIQAQQGSVNLGILLPIVLILAAFLLLVVVPITIVYHNKVLSKNVIIRITHEGVLFSSHFSTVISWNDFSSIAPCTWTYMGRRMNSLVFMPRDPEAMLAQITEQRSKNTLSRVLAKINAYIYRNSNIPSPFMIPSVIISPMSLDELLTTIQERFAHELQRNHVAVLGWQESKGGVLFPMDAEE